MNLMSIIRMSLATGLLLASTIAGASVLQTWDLTNKSPGALGADYGLRLNQVGSLGLTGASNSMIFDFEAASHGVQMQLINNAGDLEMHLSGTAEGALWDGVNDYSSDYAGTYAIDFVWKNIEANVLGFGSSQVFDYLAENGIGNHSVGAGTGSVTGVTAGTAFGSGQTLLDYSGAYRWTLDVDSTNNPDASGWLSYNGSQHNGDFGFSMVAVPAPGGLALFGLGLLLLGSVRRRVRR